MNYRTKAKFFQAYNAGFSEECANDIRRYGRIITRNDYEESEGYYKGCNSWIIAEYIGYRWAMHFVNGNLTELYWTARFE